MIAISRFISKLHRCLRHPQESAPPRWFWRHHSFGRLLGEDATSRQTNGFDHSSADNTKYYICSRGSQYEKKETVTARDRKVCRAAFPQILVHRAVPLRSTNGTSLQPPSPIRAEVYSCCLMPSVLFIFFLNSNQIGSVLMHSVMYVFFPIWLFSFTEFNFASFCLSLFVEFFLIVGLL